MSYVRNLDDYYLMPETDSCYLDGGYFKKVFQDYPGLLPPLTVSIRPNKYNEAEEKVYLSMDSSNIDTTYPGILRLIIQTPTSRHSNLLILDYQAGVIYRFEPLGVNAPYFQKVNTLVSEYLNIYHDFDLQLIDIDLNMVLDEKNPDCLHLSGFCTAYNILYAYAFLTGKNFNPVGIRRFASKVESEYGPIEDSKKEVEYGLITEDNKNQKRNMLIGGVGGLVLGGAVGGLGGAALLGGLGTLGGAVI